MTIEDPGVRHLFFTGKGGVGKTSLACATALALADSGLRTLIVSTDPASNLDEVFGCGLGHDPAPIPGAPGLFGANLDPAASAARYREKVVSPFRGKLPPAVIRSMEEQFSGACTTEIAAFDEFVRLMVDPGLAEAFDRIVFDTAPTGHTLRLLSLPGAWTGYLETTTSEASCLGPLAGLADQREAYASALAALADPGQTAVILVARPDSASLKEAERTRAELAELGVRRPRLVVNAVYQPEPTDDPIALAFALRVKQSLEAMPPGLAACHVESVPLQAGNLVGLGALRSLARPSQAPSGIQSQSFPPPSTLRLAELAEELAQGGRGVVMTMGKGGVGKTTVAAQLALLLAEQGQRVLLTTTDPAGNVEDALAQSYERLQVARIDPQKEVQRYTQAALASAAETMDEDGLALLAEDLRSPCTEEIAVFRAFAEAVAQGEDRIVVIDTAPTGHTILLMDATEAYHREVARTQSDAPDSVRMLLPRLRDPEFTRVVLVALPEPTPVHEAMRLEDDLMRAGISVHSWVVNRSLSALQVREPILSSRAASEAGPLAEAANRARRLVVLPWSAAASPTMA